MPAGKFQRLCIDRLDATVVFSSGLLLASFVLLSVILLATGLRVDWTGLGLCIAFSIATVLLGLCLKLTGGSRRIANFALVLGALIGSTVCNTMSVNAGLRLHFPLVDPLLHGADAALGFDPVALVRFFADHAGFTALLQLVYENSTWIAVLVVILHSFRRENGWVPLVCYSGGLLTISTISTLMPARGNIAYSGLSYLQDQGLPSGAGTYYLGAFSYYYEGTGEIVSNAHLSGVAVFPSFHTVMALLIATSLYGTRLALLGAAFGIAVIISAIPIGGHYVTDLVAGTLVWALGMWIAEAPRRNVAKRTAETMAATEVNADNAVTA